MMCIRFWVLSCELNHSCLVMDASLNFPGGIHFVILNV